MPGGSGSNAASGSDTKGKAASARKRGLPERVPTMDTCGTKPPLGRPPERTTSLAAPKWRIAFIRAVGNPTISLRQRLSSAGRRGTALLLHARHELRVVHHLVNQLLHADKGFDDFLNLMSLGVPVEAAEKDYRLRGNAETFRVLLG